MNAIPQHGIALANLKALFPNEMEKQFHEVLQSLLDAAYITIDAQNGVTKK